MASPAPICSMGWTCRRYLALEQRPRLGVRPPSQGHRGPRGSEPTIHRRGRHRDQQSSELIVDVELPEPPQRRDQLSHHRREPLASGSSQDRPAEPQRGKDLRPVQRRPGPPCRRHELWAHSCRQGLPRMVTVPPRGRAQLVQDLALVGLLARRQRVAIAFVTAWRCPIVSPMSRPYRQPHSGPRRRAHHARIRR